MFAYCTEVLHLSEAEAYLRIAAARASREHPLLLTMLADGRLHLSGIAQARAAPHPGERRGALEACRPQVQAADRGADRRARAQTGRSGGDAEAARERGDSTSDSLASLGLKGSGAFRARRRSGIDWTSEPAESPYPPTGAGSLGSERSGSGVIRRLVRTELSASRRPLRRPRRRLPQSSSPWRRPGTRCSSPPAPSSITSWSGFER